MQLTYQISQRKEVLRREDTSIAGVYRTIWSIVKLKRRAFWYSSALLYSNRFQMSNPHYLYTCSLKSAGRRMMRPPISKWSRRVLARRTLLLQCSSIFHFKSLADTWLRAGHAEPTRCVPGCGRFGPVSGSCSSGPSLSGGSQSRQFQLDFSYFWYSRRSLDRFLGK